MKFNIGDKLHISGDITVTGANKCGDGIYSYNTDIGTTFREPVLDKLVCKTASVKPQDKPKFKAGDKAKVTGNTSGHYFRMGEIVQLISFDDCACEPSWLARSTKNDSSWWIHERDMEPYAEPEKQEPVKLYCVKDYAGFYARGNVYEIDNAGYMHMEGRISSCTYSGVGGFFDAHPQLHACLVPLVSRPAKAGEWIIATTPDGHNAKINVPYKVVSLGPPPLCEHWATVRDGVGTKVIRLDQYLTLDGYDGRYEQTEQPKLYSGKVVCVEANFHLTNSFTAGKVYTFENGKVADNDGDARPLDDAMETLAGWNEEHGGIAKFIEYKGEAT